MEIIIDELNLDFTQDDTDLSVYYQNTVNNYDVVHLPLWTNFYQGEMVQDANLNNVPKTPIWDRLCSVEDFEIEDQTHSRKYETEQSFNSECTETIYEEEEEDYISDIMESPSISITSEEPMSFSSYHSFEEDGNQLCNFHIQSCDNLHLTDNSQEFSQDLDNVQNSTVAHLNNRGSCFYFPLIPTKNDDFSNLRCFLIRKYQDLVVPQIPWIDDGLDWNIEEYFMEMKMGTVVTDTHLTELFSEVDSMVPTRILIEGQPGFGKTTLCNKIMFDWANQKTYLQQFELGFLIPLRCLKRRKVKDVVFTISKGSGIDSNCLDRILEEKSSSILLVLDGFDELRANDRRNVIKILYRKIFPNATVIITTRTGFFDVKRHELKDVFYEEVKTEFSDKKISLKGIYENDLEMFLKKFGDICCSEVMQYLHKTTKFNKDLFRSPLLVKLLIVIAEEKRGHLHEELDTRTKMYKCLFNCIIRRSIARNKTKFDCEISAHDKLDIFDAKNLQVKIFQEVIAKCGKVFRERLLQESIDLQFEDKKEMKSLYNLGFLVAHRHDSLTRTVKHFEVFHLSFLEFMVAYSFWLDFNKNDLRLDGKSLADLRQLFDLSHGSTLVIPFLFGLLEEHVDQLVLQLQPFITVDGYSGNNLLQMIENVDFGKIVSIELLSQLITPNVEMICDTIKRTEFLKYCIETKRVKIFQLHENLIDCKWLQKMKIPLLDSKVFDRYNKLQNKNVFNLRTMKCQSLILDFTNIATINKEYEEFQKIKSFFRLISADKIILRNRSSKIKEFLKKISNNLPDRTSIDALDTFLKIDTTSDFEDLCRWLQDHKVKKLKVHFQMWNLRVKLSLLSTKTNLDTLIIDNLDSEFVDLKELTQNGKRHWKKLSFSRIQMRCDSALVTPTCIDQLIMKDCVMSSPALFRIAPKVLICNCDTLYNVFQVEDVNWPGYQSVMSLTLCDFDCRLEFWDKIFRFTNLKDMKLNWKDLECCPLDFVARSIRSLRIKSLQIVYGGSEDERILLHKIFDSNNKFAECEIKILTIIKNETLNSNYIDMSALVEFLKKSNLTDLRLLNFAKKKWQLTFMEKIANDKTLRIEREYFMEDEFDSSPYPENALKLIFLKKENNN